MKKKKLELIPMSQYFAVRGKTYPQVFQIPTEWIPEEKDWTETTLLRKEELVDMGSRFSKKYTELKNTITQSEIEIKKLNKQVIKKRKKNDSSLSNNN